MRPRRVGLRRGRLAGVTAVYCSRRGLDAVPPTVPPVTRQLHLNGNHFQSPVVRRANFSRFPDVLLVRQTSVLVRVCGIRHPNLTC